MKTFIGTKVIQAEPIYSDAQNILISELASCESAIKGYAVTYQDGYTSWSPKDVFEEAYHETDKMNFGDAIYMLKRGSRVARAGWNGKGMYLFLIGVKDSNDYWTYTNGKNDNYPLLPFIAMKTADNKVVPWLCSQTDMLSEDWCIVE